MTTYTALIVDDEPDIRDLLEITLTRMGITTLTAPDLTSARKLLEQNTTHLCLTDMNLPDGNGIELVQWIQKHSPATPVAVITAYGNMDTAIESLKAGAFDFVSKPVELPRLRELVNSALKLAEPKADTEDTADEPGLLLGKSPEIRKLRNQTRKLARSQAPVFISGESGSGKELFRSANGGTLFLDEVADLPLAMQVKLLRAIQEKAVRPVGDTKEVPVDIRVLSATHKNLPELVQEGSFRQDLFYRINVIELAVPPLRERPDDIPLLSSHILGRIAKEYECDPAALTPEAIERLRGYDFPGNVRELENVLERAFTLCDADQIGADDLHLGNGVQHAASATQIIAEGQAGEGEGVAVPDGEIDLEGYLETIERQAIEKALEATRWNKTAAAKRLGISFRALRYRLKKLGME